MAQERLQKLIARAGLASRRQAERWIEGGQVRVNGEVARLGDRADLATDAIKVRGKLLEAPLQHRTYLLNKPARTVCTRKDPEGRETVFDCLPASLRKGLFSVGRLDWDTEGALVLTTDGDLAQKVAHPSHSSVKRYLVKVRGVPGSSKLSKLRSGMPLYGKPTMPARIEPYQVSGERESKKNSWWSVELREGRTRQIREMFFRVGHPVVRLRRVSIGALQLGDLRTGAWRPLNEHDISLLNRTGKPIPAARWRGARGPSRRSAKPSQGRTPRKPGSRGSRKGSKRGRRR